MRYQVTLSQRARPTRAWCGAMNQRAQAKTKTKNRNIPGIAHRTSSKVRRELRLCPTGLLMLRSVLRTDETNVLARYQVALSHPSHPSPRTNHHHHHHTKSEYKNKAASPSPPRENQTSQSKNDTVQSFPQHLRANVRVRPTHRFLGEKISYLRILITLALDTRRQRRTRDTTHAPCTTAHTHTQNLDVDRRANHRDDDDDDASDDDDRVAAYPHHAPIARVPGRTPHPIVVV